jgi:hypothetical protein
MTTSWSADDLRSASRLYDACGDGIAAVSGTVTAMDPASYGSFVAHVAAGAEPATSEASRECIRAIAAATGFVGDGLLETAVLYEQVERENVAAVEALLDSINSVFAGPR